MFSHEKDGLSTYHVPIIEIGDKWMQTADVSCSFCLWSALWISKHQTDHENRKLYVLDKFSKIN